VAKSVAVRSLDDLRALARSAREADAWIALVGASLELRSEEWLWHALGLRELAPDAAVIGGRIVDAAGSVCGGAGVFGFDGLAGSPEAGHDARDPGYFATFLKQRSASTVPAALCTFDPALVEGVESLALLAAWLGALAARSGRRVAFSPFLAATTRADAALAASPDEVARFRAAHGDLVPDERFYPRAFGLDRAHAFQLARRAGGRA
jgi:hypothetical protein